MTVENPFDSRLNREPYARNMHAWPWLGSLWSSTILIVSKPPLVAKHTSGANGGALQPMVVVDGSC